MLEERKGSPTLERLVAGLKLAAGTLLLGLSRRVRAGLLNCPLCSGTRILMKHFTRPSRGAAVEQDQLGQAFVLVGVDEAQLGGCCTGAALVVYGLAAEYGR
mmetsp:Transcript_91110/g.211967  ORF Transcript_91110/g.211967 Transcript_91110/m.211967 type:complete len:102 (+) Transcript_91110:778-1083(+)